MRQSYEALMKYYLGNSSPWSALNYQELRNVISLWLLPFVLKGRKCGTAIQIPPSCNFNLLNRLLNCHFCRVLIMSQNYSIYKL